MIFDVRQSSDVCPTICPTFVGQYFRKEIMAKIKKSWRLSDVALQRLNTLVELENRDAARYEIAQKSQAEVLEDAINQMYLSKTSGKYQSVLLQTMEDNVATIINQNLRGFIKSLNENLLVTMKNYELSKLALCGLNISLRPEVIDEKLATHVDFETKIDETVAEKIRNG